MNPVEGEQASEGGQSLDEAPRPRRFRVQGKWVVVRDGAILPQFCIKTNMAVSPEDMETRRLNSVPSDAFWFAFLGSIPFLAAMLVSREPCTVTFGMAPQTRQRLHQIQVTMIAVVMIAIPAILIFLAFPSGITFCLAGSLCVAAIVLFVNGTSPIRVYKQNSGEFWIEGCSKEFLARITPDLPLPFAFNSDEQ